jgi:5'-nucleotidase
MARLSDQTHLHVDTKAVISKERKWRKRHNLPNESKFQGAQLWQHAAAVALQLRSYAHYKDQINVSAREHMSEVDCFDGGKARKGSIGEVKQEVSDLITIHPRIDGRLKDEGRS